MASPIYFRDQRVALSNVMFANLVEFALSIASSAELHERERAEVQRLRNMDDSGELWPGRGFHIEVDFEEFEARKFWARIFLEVGQGIFHRKVGNHENDTWQVLYIAKAYAVAMLFVDAVREVEKGWYPPISAEKHDMKANGDKTGE